MNDFITETYTAKREILTYAQKLSDGFSRPDTKFVSDMVYGIIASGSIILSDISDALMEDIEKGNTVERLSRHLKEGLPSLARTNYAMAIRNDIPKDPVILLDDSDVVKPFGKKFESLGRVRDGSSKDFKIENGYWVTEAVALSKEKQPISLYSRVYSQSEKDFKSTNTYTFNAIDDAIKQIRGTGTFVCDRGYDFNEIYERFYDRKQYFIIRLTEKRKLFFKGKWYKAATLMKSRKGKFKTTLKFQSGEKECYVSFINVQITASKRPLRLVCVYGLGEMPMMLATNKQIMGKDDVVEICRMYLSRWRIEEYFRFKKQHFGFENFRVRSLKAINSLNMLLTFSISFLNNVMGKKAGHRLKTAVYEKAKTIREKVLFHYYRIAKGIAAILALARAGIKDWYKPKPRIKSPQLTFNLRC
jgi:IS4 transposase